MLAETPLHTIAPGQTHISPEGQDPRNFERASDVEKRAYPRLPLLPSSEIFGFLKNYLNKKPKQKPFSLEGRSRLLTPEEKEKGMATYGGEGGIKDTMNRYFKKEIIPTIEASHAEIKHGPKFLRTEGYKQASSIFRTAGNFGAMIGAELAIARLARKAGAGVSK